MLAGLISVTMMLSNQSALSRRSSSHNPDEFQDKFVKTDIDLRVPAPLQSSIQSGDLNLPPTAEELRVPESLRTSIQQGELSPSKPTTLSSNLPQQRHSGDSYHDLIAQPETP
jgi:hypothetical protein